MNPNWSQVYGIARIVVPAVISVLAFTHVITDSMAANLTVFVASVLGSSALSAMGNTDASIVKAASVVQGVKPIEVTPAAAPSIQALAADNGVPSVVAVPSFPPTTQRR